MTALWQGEPQHNGGGYWSEPMYPPMHFNSQQTGQRDPPIVIQPMNNGPPNDGYHHVQYGDPPPGYMDPHMNHANIDPNNYNCGPAYPNAAQV